MAVPRKPSQLTPESQHPTDIKASAPLSQWAGSPDEGADVSGPHEPTRLRYFLYAMLLCMLFAGFEGCGRGLYIGYTVSHRALILLAFFSLVPSALLAVPFSKRWSRNPRRRAYVLAKLFAVCFVMCFAVQLSAATKSVQGSSSSASGPDGGIGLLLFPFLSITFLLSGWLAPLRGMKIGFAVGVTGPAVTALVLVLASSSPPPPERMAFAVYGELSRIAQGLADEDIATLAERLGESSSQAREAVLRNAAIRKKHIRNSKEMVVRVLAAYSAAERKRLRDCLLDICEWVTGVVTDHCAAAMSGQPCSLSETTSAAAQRCRRVMKPDFYSRTERGLILGVKTALNTEGASPADMFGYSVELGEVMKERIAWLTSGDEKLVAEALAPPELTDTAIEKDE